MPPQTKERYLTQKLTSNNIIWKFNSKYKFIPKGKILRIHCQASATVRWTSDDWQTSHDVTTLDSGVGVHFADLSTVHLSHGQQVGFTFYWHDTKNWENFDYSLCIEKNIQIEKPVETIIEDKKLRNKTKIYYPS